MPKIDPEERLLNLMIALMHVKTRMSRAEIRSRVTGYEREDTSWDDATKKRRKEAFERMFERDKDALRTLGVPIVTVTSEAHGDDIGYRIDPEQASLPPLDFTAAESAVVALAADYWRGVALGADASQAWVKASSQVAHSEVQEMPFATMSTHLSDAAAVLVEAIQQRREVTFGYTSASSGDGKRRVQPWRILLSGGADYLVGFDVDREAPRTYRLSRVTSAVALVGEADAFDIPDVNAQEALDRDGAGGVARLAIRPEAAHALRRQGTVVGEDGDWDLVDVPFTHQDDLRDRILAMSGTVRVIEPALLRDRVLASAQAALAALVEEEARDGDE
ncbi:helix-turn-helix transcriptional regulator [Demequina sediminicola]|uniref:helix-turn-helix transcriptional regulator n=1 Tax=Demequina sediminicola TaxID=1095026 RepID=UPI0007837BCD|nr:WYL domain-containing protein [Demequina sediminicola]